jgi:hypothetical protein
MFDYPLKLISEFFEIFCIFVYTPIYYKKVKLFEIFTGPVTQ